MKLTPYNQAFKDALQYLSKYVYINKGSKAIQNNIVELSHWLDANPDASRKALLAELAKTIRVEEKRVRY